ncbi:hypothetical protein pdam_00018716 [Pocillopora damicornis]|uniref:Uncharacterized protein n=1 Tax=Pocillopora damicornis TaxID=46731 RepID=A0A3M6TZ46_POCDA|nr:hypothetical protein pdam_00018716 [Pocillopora damicornis]
MKDKYRPASAIVDEVLLKELSDTAPCASLLKLIMTSRADIMPLIAGHKADAACPFTCLLTSKLTLVEIKLVSDGKLSKFQGKVYRQQQRKIFKA